MLVEMCRRFFRRFPQGLDLAEPSDSAAESVRGLVRPGQVPFVVSIAQALREGVPSDRENLLRIKGVGGKIAECVLAYGWGKEALPLDANCIRVLERVSGPGGPQRFRQMPGPLREGLKCVYLKQPHRFADLSIRMVGYTRNTPAAWAGLLHEDAGLRSLPAQRVPVPQGTVGPVQGNRCVAHYVG